MKGTATYLSAKRSTTAITRISTKGSNALKSLEANLSENIRIGLISK